MSSADVSNLLTAAVSGDRRARARLLSMVERGGPEGREVARATFSAADAGYSVGITGAPGAGKSTLTSALVARMRRDEIPLAVLAIDPSSPFSGGAILGDRVRMDTHVLDPGVFIRSMATRGHVGGLSLAALEAARVLMATGALWVLLETVGVGQVEIDVASAADTTVVVLNPGWGDAVQASKAGLMEIADVFVINKADRDGATQTRRDLKQMLRMVERPDWNPPVVETVATEHQGIDALWDAIRSHRGFAEASGDLTRRRVARVRSELQVLVSERLRRRARDLVGTDEGERLEAAVLRGDLDPYSATDELLKPVL